MVFINSTGKKFVAAQDWSAATKGEDYILRINSTVIPIEQSDFDGLLSAVQSSKDFYQFTKPVSL